MTRSPGAPRMSTEHGKNSVLRALGLISRELPAAGVESLLVGGMAVNHYGYTRSTLDVDLMIAAASSFATLFRHSLIALGKDAPASRRDAASRQVHDEIFHLPEIYTLQVRHRLAHELARLLHINQARPRGYCSVVVRNVICDPGSFRVLG